MATTIVSTGIVFGAGVLVGFGVAWRRNETLRMDVRTLHAKLDDLRRDEFADMLDTLGPVVPPVPDQPADVRGPVMFDQDHPTDNPDTMYTTYMYDPHHWEP